MKEYRQTRFAAPEGATEILLVRHGESRPATPDNPFPLVDGHGDPELHENGRQQAALVGARLKSHPIRAVYVSNLKRTHETAAPLCSHLGLEPRIDADLREVFLGEWEGGLFRIHAAQNHPAYLQMHEEQRWDAIPGAESWDTINARLTRALNRIHQAHPNELVAAFVHGGVIGHILAHATGAEPFAFNGADNGSINHIIMHDGRIRVRRFNDTTHLYDTIHSGAGQMT